MADPNTAFNEAHPPLMQSADVLPPPRSDYGTIGAPLMIKGADMNRVMDALYDWRPYLGNPQPAYHKKVVAIIQKRNAEVDHYLMTRRRYWERVERYHYAVDTQVQVTKHHGVVHHSSHIVDHSKSTTERLSLELGVDPSAEGASVPDVPEIPPVVPGPLLGGAGVSFSQDMTETLHITDSDETTYTDDTSTTVTQTFLGGTTYIQWVMKEECILERVRKGQASPDSKPVSIVEAQTTVDYMDSFPRSSNPS
ncbi:MAG: hypothetical protein QOG38_1390 [Hyphomicrobiales bacterium]|nr:hypothetical protein [Hyphomicrobiales bacterium]